VGERAQDRAARINQFMWDAQAGLYFDYEFRIAGCATILTSPRSTRCGPASRARNRLPPWSTIWQCLSGRGLATSTNATGNQWDSPFGWAPLEMIAVEGLRRYGYNEEANRISREFLSLVLEQYQQSGIIVEKYDVVRRTSRVSGEIHFGYSSTRPDLGGPTVCSRSSTMSYRRKSRRGF